MSLPLVINPLAEADLADARAWYESQRSGLGDELIAGVDVALRLVQEHPLTPAIVFRDVRRVLVRRFPYGIFYRVDDDQITVIAVYHARRDPRSWQTRG